MQDLTKKCRNEVKRLTKVTSSYSRESLPLEMSSTGFLTRTYKRIVATKGKKKKERIRVEGGGEKK